MLRIEDGNGLYSDAVVQITNNEDSTGNAGTESAKTGSISFDFLPIALVGLAVLLVGGGAFLFFKKKTSQK